MREQLQCSSASGLKINFSNMSALRANIFEKIVFDNLRTSRRRCLLERPQIIKKLKITIEHWRKIGPAEKQALVVSGFFALKVVNVVVK